MKALKITLILVAVVLLAMSGLSNENLKTDSNDQINNNNVELNLITHSRGGTTPPSNT